MQIAGTMRQATVKPEIPLSMFPVKAQKQPFLGALERPISNTSRRRVESIGGRRKSSETCDEFGDDDIDDIDLVQAAGRELDFEHIENYDDATTVLTRQYSFNNTSSKKRKHTEPHAKEDDGPRQLPNGKWACNHKCKDKNACKHICCRDGLHKPPKRHKITELFANSTLVSRRRPLLPRYLLLCTKSRRILTPKETSQNFTFKFSYSCPAYPGG